MAEIKLPAGSKFTEDPLENRRIWVEALRSGKYPQGRDALRRRGGYCCLGVACDLWNPKGWELEDESNEEYSCAGAAELLPSAVSSALGFDDAGPRVDDQGLSDLNDFGTPFSRIADLIEAQPPEWRG